MTLGRVQRLLAQLGNPERRLPPVVHVTGTNGKGSTLAYLRTMLEAAGYAVHAYSSPHLVRFKERIRLAGALITEADLSATLHECEDVNAGAPITFFEITTAAAFVAFTRVSADILLLENGLGGRLDATNVVAAPALTAITPISLDHQSFLGETLAEIASEKAGILKPGVPCALAPQPPAAAHVIERAARDIGAPLIAAGRDWSVDGTAAEMTVRVGATAFDLPPPGLQGAHQIVNAGLAVAMAQNLTGFTVPVAAMAAGLGRVEWPARLQRLTRGLLIDGLPAGWELWLDGGHNPAAGESLSQHARTAWAAQPLMMICGMLRSKACADFLRPFATTVDAIRTVDIPGEDNTVSAAELAAVARGVGIQASPAVSAAAAIEQLATAANAPPTARILICGSLYLAGSLLAENG